MTECRILGSEATSAEPDYKCGFSKTSVGLYFHGNYYPHGYRKGAQVQVNKQKVVPSAASKLVSISFVQKKRKERTGPRHPTEVSNSLTIIWQ